MQTCKRFKRFKRCKRFKEISKEEAGRVWQFFFCLLDFTPVDHSANLLLTIFDYTLYYFIYFRHAFL